jgi:copper homeostasis protein (lipoprotein)
MRGTGNAMRRRIRIMPAALLLALAVGAPHAGAETLTGTATWRERIALPPGSVFEAEIRDIARADAPAPVLARTEIAEPGQPPVAFAIDYDPAALDPRAIYALRATIRHEGRLLFTSDTILRVLRDGDPSHVQVPLVMVTGNRARKLVGGEGLEPPTSSV